MGCRSTATAPAANQADYQYETSPAISFLAGLPATLLGRSEWHLTPSFARYPTFAAHAILATVLANLIVVHVLAAVYHQLVRKDDLLSRMLWGRRAANRPWDHIHGGLLKRAVRKDESVGFRAAGSKRRRYFKCARNFTAHEAVLSPRIVAAAIPGVLQCLSPSRVRQISRQFAIRLEERVSERTRIARELHDSLLQGFQGLMFRLQAVLELLGGVGT